MEQKRQAGTGPLERPVSRVVAWVRRWRDSRRWTAEMQLEHLRVLMQGDHRWLAHDKTADALTTRYLAALAPDWYKRVHTDVRHFRRDIGLEPVTVFSAINSPENLARLNRIAQGEPAYSHGPCLNVDGTDA